MVLIQISTGSTQFVESRQTINDWILLSRLEVFEFIVDPIQYCVIDEVSELSTWRYPTGFFVILYITGRKNYFNIINFFVFIVSIDSGPWVWSGGSLKLIYFSAVNIYICIFMFCTEPPLAKRH